jgi:hypothetical protein
MISSMLSRSVRCEAEGSSSLQKSLVEVKVTVTKATLHRRSEWKDEGH